jgi:hypothetical protein
VRQRRSRHRGLHLAHVHRNHPVRSALRTCLHRGLHRAPALSHHHVQTFYAAAQHHPRTEQSDSRAAAVSHHSRARTVALPLPPSLFKPPLARASPPSTRRSRHVEPTRQHGEDAREAPHPQHLSNQYSLLSGQAGSRRAPNESNRETYLSWLSVHPVYRGRRRARVAQTWRTSCWHEARAWTFGPTTAATQVRFCRDRLFPTTGVSGYRGVRGAEG